jgi:peptide methionine sulfoxide reductase MsrA
MRYDIYQNGKLKWSIEGTDKTITANDITILPKQLAKNCSVSAETFDDIFFSELKTSTTHVEAYEKAEQLHEQYFEKRKYADYDSYRISKNQRLKK